MVNFYPNCRWKKTELYVYVFVNIKIQSCFYSCRCRLCFLLPVSRGSHGESSDISHSSLQLCCANRHIDHEPEEQRKKKHYLQKHPDKSCVDLFIRSQFDRIISLLMSELFQLQGNFDFRLKSKKRHPRIFLFWSYSDGRANQYPQTPDQETSNVNIILYVFNEVCQSVFNYICIHSDRRSQKNLTAEETNCLITS